MTSRRFFIFVMEIVLNWGTHFLIVVLALLTCGLVSYHNIIDFEGLFVLLSAPLREKWWHASAEFFSFMPLSSLLSTNKMKN